MSRRSGFFLMFLALAGLMGCRAKAPENVGLPQTLRIAVEPGQSDIRLRRKYGPLVDYLSATLGIECTLAIPGSFEALRSEFNQQKADLVHLSGASFVKVHIETGAIPLVISDRDTHFSSYVLARSDLSARNVSDLRGASFA